MTHGTAVATNTDIQIHKALGTEDATDIHRLRDDETRLRGMTYAKLNYMTRDNVGERITLSPFKSYVEA